MKKTICLFLLIFSFNAFSQTYQEDSNYENEEDSFNYDPSYDGHMEYPTGPEVYDDMIANEATEEYYLNEDQ